uniref:PARP-type domain-containing protein n=1 Tax=Pelagomonas calceolata TaxID=35677 RepID=A0A7S4A5G1_9STRA|mmetsp:Transcript_2478/g.7482  ORF Transcript_2478/g.7482 Transcript_2478/m.7482 type:complete len:259 (-) Transcript_2478:44-820(-)
MEHKIVISGEGSAHPKLGVKKKNSVEENLKILNDMIESGKLSLDHAIAKTRPGGTLRGIFKCSEDDEMLSHVEALYDFVVAYKKRLVPDYDPSAPVKKVQKDVDPEKFAPKVEQAKSSRATCKMTGEKIDAGELRVGLPVFCRGQQVTAWQKAAHFSKALRFETAPDNRSKCKASKEKITKGEIRLCARVGTFAQLEANDEINKMFYNPMAIRPFWKAFHEATGVHPSSIEGAELLDEAYHKALLDANEDERYEEADC